MSKRAFVTSYVARFRSEIILAGILVLAVLVRIPYITRSLWYDELWATFVRLENWLRLGNNALYDPHPPLYSVLMFFWIRIFGDSEFSVRFLPLVFGLLSIILVYLLGKLYANTPTALFTAFLLATSVVHIVYSREARPYSMVLCSILASIYSFYQIVAEGETRKWFILYLAASILAIFSNYFAGFYIFALTLICIFRTGWMVHRRLVLVNLILMTLLGLYLAVKFLFGLIVSYDSYLRPFNFQEFYRLLFNWFLLGESLADTWLVVFIQLIAVIFFLRGYGLFFSDYRKKISGFFFDLTVFFFTLPAILMVFSLFGSGRVYIERSLIFLLPFFLLVLARGSIDFKHRLPRIISPLVIGVVNLLVLTTAFSRDFDKIVTHTRPDWRSAAAFLAQDTRAVDHPVILYATFMSTSLTYYDNEIFEDTNLESTMQDKLGTIVAKLGGGNVLTNILSEQLEQYSSEIKSRKDQAKIIIQYPDINRMDEEIAEIPSNGPGCFYLLDELTYSGDFKKLLAAVASNSQVESAGTTSFPGIEIYTFCRVD